MVKVMQYGCQMIMGYYAVQLSENLNKGLQQTRVFSSNARKAFWLFKSFSHINSCISLYENGVLQTEYVCDKLDFIEQIFYIMYFALENMIFFIRSKVLTAITEDDLDWYTNFSWFGGDACALITSVLRMYEVRQQLDRAIETSTLYKLSSSGRSLHVKKDNASSASLNLMAIENSKHSEPLSLSNLFNLNENMEFWQKVIAKLTTHFSKDALNVLKLFKIWNKSNTKLSQGGEISDQNVNLDCAQSSKECPTTSPGSGSGGTSDEEDFVSPNRMRPHAMSDLLAPPQSPLTQSRHRESSGPQEVAGMTAVTVSMVGDVPYEYENTDADTEREYHFERVKMSEQEIIERLIRRKKSLEIAVLINIFEVGVSAHYMNIYKALLGRHISDGHVGLMGVVSSSLILYEGFSGYLEED